MKRILYSTILLAGLFLLAAAVPPVTAQVTPTDYGNFAGITNSFTNATTYTVNSTRIELRSVGGLAVIPFLVGTTNGTNEVVINFQVSADGTNYSTSSGLAITSALAADTNVVAKYTLFPRSLLDGVRYIRVGTVTATYGTNLFTLTRLQWARFY